MKIILQKVGSVLAATDEESAAALRRIKDGQEVVADIRRTRNVRQLRLWWSLVTIVAEAMDLPKENVKKDAAIALGFTETWIGYDGRIHIDPKSIAIENMTQEDFDSFMGKAVELLAGWINVDQQDLLNRFNELAADKRYEGMRR